MPYESLAQHGITFELNGDCWNCTSHRPNNSGYPMRHGITISRYVYRMLFGIPDGMQVLHSCDNRMCINPKHLWIGTHSDNHLDKVNKGRQSRLYGERNGRAKLTKTQVAAIRQDARKIKDIAIEYKIAFQMVSRIKRMEAWQCPGHH